MADNVFETVGKRTANLMRREDSALAANYDHVVEVLSKFNTDQQVALIAIVKHTILSDATLGATWSSCPTIRQLEAMFR